MKLNERMRFPHPVLNKHSADYSQGELTAEFSWEQTDDNQLKIISTLNIGDQEIVKLVEEQKAASGYFLVCRPTYYNHLQEAPPSISEKHFDLSLLHGRVTIRPIVWTIREVTDFNSPLIDEEFGENIKIRKGSIVAMGSEFGFSVDPRKFKPFETIFRLSIDDSVSPGMIEVDPDQDKIGILAEKGTYGSIVAMRGLSTVRAIVLSSVYMPVVADIVARIQGGDTSFEARRWYQVFKAKCDDLNIQPEDESASPLKIAQILLKAPLEGTIKTMEST